MKKLYEGSFKATGANFHPNRRTTSSKRKSIAKGMVAYESRKAGWVTDHPDATSSDYDAAMSRFARESGV